MTHPSIPVSETPFDLDAGKTNRGRQPTIGDVTKCACSLSNGIAASHRATRPTGKRSFKRRGVPKDASLNFGNERKLVSSSEVKPGNGS